MLVLSVLLAALGMGAGTALRWILARHPTSTLRVRNFREVEVPAVGGIVILGGVLVTEMFFTLVATARPLSLEGGSQTFSASAVPRTFQSFDHPVILLVVVGFFALGLIDDALGPGGSRGLMGHLKALREGRLTSGLVKAGGGLALALTAAGLLEAELLPALVDGLVIALMANLVNLLDLRPGRATKAFLLGWIPLAAAGWATTYVPVAAAVAGAAAAWLPADLKEEGMLGDSGSNMLGATLGVGVVLVLAMPWRLGILGILVVLSLASERWSFTKVIESVPPLRWMDRLGRRTEP